MIGQEIESKLQSLDEWTALYDLLKDQDDLVIVTPEDIKSKAKSMTGHWQEDRDASQCTACDKDFAIWLRRHHCRRCGCVFCHHCTSKRMVLSDSNDPERVCDSCYSILVGPDTPLTPQQLTVNVEMRMANLMSPVDERNEDGLSNCPICSISLKGLPDDELEDHVKDCFEGRSSTTSNIPMDFVIQTLENESVLIGCECLICFEEFQVGSNVARLTCLCVFHQACVLNWANGAKCPLHSS